MGNELQTQATLNHEAFMLATPARLERVSEILDGCRQASIPVALISTPGVGKVAFVINYASKRKLPLYIVRFTLGSPRVSQVFDADGVEVNITEENMSYWAIQLLENPGVLLLDDDHYFNPDVVASLVTSRTIGQFLFSDKMGVIASVNSQSDWTPTASLGNRFVHVDFLES